MDERETRLARNEAVFREVNKSAREMSESWSDSETEFQIVCECSHAACTDPLYMKVQEYRRVRAHPARFLVVPGHEIEDIETVVQEDRRFTVVEKTGEARDFVAHFARS